MSRNGRITDGWPASKVTLWPLEKIKPYPSNPRTHPPAQIALLAASMKTEGVTMPILVDEDGVIIAGHGRLLGAQQNEFKKYPVVIARGWSEEQKRAARIKDNSYSLLSGWEKGLLQSEIRLLQTSGYSLPLLGMQEFQLRSIGINLAGEVADPENIPPPPAVSVSVRGDVWLLGEHRLLCGDSTSKEDVETCLDGSVPHLMVTDPPYGVEYDANWRNERARESVGMGNRAIGAGAIGKVQNDHNADWREAWALFGGDVAYCWCASLTNDIAIAGIEAAGLERRSLIVWDKTRLIIGRSDYHWQHEVCWYVVRRGKPGHWNGDRSQTTVWQIPHQKSETGHSTQKPIECMKRPIENNSRAGDAVYEPFSGSGTTIIAAEMTKRRCVAIEINPTYVDVAVLRWQEFSGLQATHAASGASFDDVRKERLKAPKAKRGASGARRGALRRAPAQSR